MLMDAHRTCASPLLLWAPGCSVRVDTYSQPTDKKGEGNSSAEIFFLSLMHHVNLIYNTAVWQYLCLCCRNSCEHIFWHIDNTAKIILNNKQVLYYFYYKVKPTFTLSTIVISKTYT